jgi:hypothetical protein
MESDVKRRPPAFAEKSAKETYSITLSARSRIDKIAGFVHRRKSLVSGELDDARSLTERKRMGCLAFPLSQ